MIEYKTITDKENRSEEIGKKLKLKAEKKGISSKDSLENSFTSLCLEVAGELNLSFNVENKTFKEIYLK